MEYPVFNPEGSFIGSVSVMFKPERFLGEIIQPLVKRVPLEITMEMQTKKEANVTMVTITGRLDAVTVPEYEKTINELIAGGKIAFVLDFQDLDYISSAGLRGLLATAKRLKGKGRQLRFANVKGTVKEVFDISGFGSIFQIDDSVAASLAKEYNVNQNIAPSRVVLVVDGYSTGQFYPEAIREKGLRPVHVSSGTEKNSPGLESYVTEALEHMRHDYDAMFHDWNDIDELVASLAALAPCSVMPGCEMGVEMADLLAQRLGLPGNDAATSHIRRDKLAMHDTLAKAGLPSLASLATDNFDEALAFAADLDSWPVVVKPLRSAATEGVRFCYTTDELRDAFAALLGTFTQFGERNALVLVQQCATGREYAVNTVSREGRHVLSDLWVYDKIPTPGGAPLYDRTQLVLTQDQDQRAIIDYTFQVLDALGVRIGPAHTEIMLTEQGPILIESGARPMGGAFPQDLIRETLGHTQIQWAVDSYVDAVAFAANAGSAYRPTHAICVKSLISTQEGAIRSVPAINLAMRLPSVRYGSFISVLSKGHVARTVDLLTSPAHLFLYHQFQAVVDADWSTLRELEINAQNELFKMSPADASLESQDDWFAHLPDE